MEAYGLTQEFTTPYTPEPNGLVERFFRSLKEECNGTTTKSDHISPWAMWHPEHTRH
ncbi:integrase core domain-containing protein [Halomonas sp. V046]|uniref:integrase core domain-containing protein n=1 Tax=Halomonas sp. V046 TaxID=3459611 RepID=UPI004044EEE2